VRTGSANRVDPLEDGESGVESKAATPSSATFRTGKRIYLEDTLKEFGPGSATLRSRFFPSA
jgi:hypothetical protein